MGRRLGVDRTIAPFAPLHLSSLWALRAGAAACPGFGAQFDAARLTQREAQKVDEDARAQRAHAGDGSAAPGHYRRCVKPAGWEADFVSSKDGQLWRGGVPYRFLGANLW